MRLRILELPTEHDGDRMRTPFVYVIDDVSEEQFERVTQFAANRDHWTRGGAAGAFLFTDRIQLGYEESA